MYSDQIDISIWLRCITWFYFLVPIGSPSDVNVSRVDDTGSELVISWKPVPTDQLNGQLLGYKVW